LHGYSDKISYIKNQRGFHCNKAHGNRKDIMGFLQILFWVILAVLIIIFSVNNWQPLTISIWGGLLVDTKLPVLVVGSFLIGFLPLYFWHRIIKWRLNRKINSVHNTPPSPPLNVNDVPNNKPVGGISPLEPKTNLESE